MSYPKEFSRYTLTDFIIEEEADFFGTGYYFYKNAGGETENEEPFARISIPPFCEEQRLRLGIFLKEFSTLLDEMLVIYDKETVARLFNEALPALFPDDSLDFELGFCKRMEHLYCMIQYSAEGYWQRFGRERSKPYVEEYPCDDEFVLPPKRLMFQERDEVWETYNERLQRLIQKAKRRREQREQWMQQHPGELPRGGLYDYVKDMDDTDSTDGSGDGGMNGTF